MSNLDNRSKARRGFAAMSPELRREISLKGVWARFHLTDVHGRPRQYDYAEIKRLRTRGLALQAIADRVGCSYNTAFLACNDKARERLLKTSQDRRRKHAEGVHHGDDRASRKGSKPS